MELKKSICFAYFGDNDFIGWYAGSFGSIRNTPKIYGNSIEQLETITKNFQYKISIINEKSDLANVDPRLVIIDSGMNSDSDTIMRYENIELRIVECPHYDGVNPSFDKDAYEKLINDRHEQMKKDGIIDLPESKGRKAACAAYPRIKCNNWIYADYTQVKEWASSEPTEFIGIIKSK